MRLPGGLRWLFVVFALAAWPCWAQGTPSPAAPAPPAMSQQQMDTMVEAISQSVMKKLQAQGAQPTPPSPDGSGMQMASAQQTEMFMHVGGLVTGLPALWAEFGKLVTRLDADYNDGRGLGRYFLLLIGALAAALAAEWVVRLLLTPLRRRLVIRMHGLHGIRALLGLGALELPPLIALWIVGNASEAARFMGDLPQTRFSIAMLKTMLIWRLLQAVFRFTLQPRLPEARLPDLGDADARAIYRGASFAILLLLFNAVLADVLRALQSPPLAVGTAQLYGAVVMMLGMVAVCIRLNGPIGRWFIGVANPAQASPVKTAIAKHWLLGALLLFALFVTADIYAAVAGQTRISGALMLTLAILVALLVVESLVHRIRIMLQHQTDGVRLIHPRGAEALARCARFGVLILAIGALGRTWAVDVSGVMAGDDFNRVARNLFSAGLTAFAAYCAWELVRYITDRYSAGRSGPALPGAADAEDDAPVSTASRIATMMPVFRIGLAIAISILAVLTVLSQLGVNVTPLIAGASIFGLAISFGSQTLVKDVVSGVFFLIDDAFRVGEYIDVGKAKGTVEGFTLRSLRLRHQNGPVHTIPYGQLGQVTNYSRDWATIKFPLRFARETDLEKLRKAVKKIGQDMLEDPEMKEEFLTPLKMQGVFDITDNAIVVRFKFTVKPNKPTFIQREALKRLVRILPEQGIEFSTGTVAVRTLDGEGRAGLGAAVAANAALALPPAAAG
ncbi:mechanosensitive ion channel family protein [Labrys sp. (in: a-proteobacteria)]|uniref:mechanosensitive ion channel family protein n=1 Tax=Labrys sp. (in: a-proteobacteria) TaxID=1917972 RepID=UPI0039E38E8E